MANKSKAKRVGANGTSKGSIKRMVRDMINGSREHKVVTQTISAANAFTTGGTLIPIGNVQQGDDFYQRQGDVINVERIHINFNAYLSTSNTATTFRILVFADQMGSGGLVGITEVLDTANYLSIINVPNKQRRRFTIFHDKLYRVVGGTTVQNLPIQININRRYPKYFNDTTSNATSTGKNATYMLVIASNTSGSYDYITAFTFTDS